MSDVDPSRLHGFNPNSPYAQLFLDIFHLTKPKDEKPEPAKVDQNMNMKDCEDEMEEGEIKDEQGDAGASAQKPKHALISYMKRVKFKKVLPPPPHHPVVPAQGVGSQKYLLDLQSQLNLDRNPVRLRWIHSLLDFMSSRGTPIKSSPIKPTAVSVSPDQNTVKQALDLYSLYSITMDQAGGMNPCTENKGWKAVAARMNVPVQKAFVLRSIYQKYLLPFEEFQSSKERKVLLPTPSYQGQGVGSSSHQGQEEGRGDKGLGGKVWKMKGNIKKRLGFKKKRGSYNFGSNFDEFHG